MSAAALALAGAPLGAQAPQSVNACYVPSVGAIYLVGLTGLPSACLGPSHVAIAIGSGALADGSVTAVKLADGAVTMAKLAFDPATQGELDALAFDDGSAPNTGANLVHWSVLRGVPAAFADGVDNEGGAPANGSITTDLLADGAVTTAKVAPGTSVDLLGGMLPSAFAVANHIHDDRYFTQVELASPGSINAGTNPVDWTRLRNVPAGFADGVDEAGGTASDIACAACVGSTDLADGAVTGDKLATVLAMANGFAAAGTVGSGAIPVEGAGARLMWYPGKAAFRAGTASGTQWDDASVGFYSMALGISTIANGHNSTAFGISTIASGNVSTALGSGTTASGHQSSALGLRTLASGAVSTALGQETVASGVVSTAMGNRTTANGIYSTALGSYAHTNGHDGSFVYGDNSTFSTGTEVTASAANQFVARAAGGFRLFTSSNTGGFTFEGGSGSGCALGAGSLSCTSVMHSASGGFKFPDGSIQVTAATGAAGGDITDVVAGSGLAGGGTSGSVTLSANLTVAGGDNGTAASVARGDHVHDLRYTTKSELGSSGTINTSGNPVHWTKLIGVPAGLADGLDDGGGVPADASVTTVKLADGAVTMAKLAADAVGSAEILDKSITGLDIALGAVGSVQIADGDVRREDIANGAVGGEKIVNGAVSSIHVLDNTLSAADLANGSVTGFELAINAVGTNHILNGEVTQADLHPTVMVARGAAYVEGLATGANLIRGRNVTSVARIALGTYEVRFNFELRTEGFWVAQANSHDIYAGTELVFLGNGLRITVRRVSGGALTDGEFHLIVF